MKTFEEFLNEKRVSNKPISNTNANELAKKLLSFINTGDLDSAVECVEEGANVNFADMGNNTPLWLSVDGYMRSMSTHRKRQWLSLITKLLDHGVKLESRVEYLLNEEFKDSTSVHTNALKDLIKKYYPKDIK